MKKYIIVLILASLAITIFLTDKNQEKDIDFNDMFITIASPSSLSNTVFMLATLFNNILSSFPTGGMY